MRIEETTRMIITNLIQNKFKVLLTSLGIIIGTVTIILVIAIGRGGEKQIADQFSFMSAETVYVNVKYSPNMNAIESVPRLNLEHLELIKEENPYLKSIYLRTNFFQEVTISGKKEALPMVAVTENYSDISSLWLEYGGDFSEADFEEGKRAVVIGYTLAEKYFGTAENALGNAMTIKGYRYEVIGVLEKKSEALQGVNPDNSIFVPFFTAESEELLEDSGFPQAVGLATNVEVVGKAMKRLKSTLDYVLEDASMYSVENAGSRIEAATESARTMNMVLISMAVIVFVVGGIGIMNVLFVSVKERTREIGILKALGTSKKDILLLFLLESVGIGVLGGLCGVIISLAALPLMRYSDIPVTAGLDGQLAALLFAISTAAIFGFYPAYKASQLKPIEALNYE
ncbi:ABC transporter permease [Desulfosporosinus nitroreducens]|uniref:ABC transporter permease n=1 Tax=Desulfosporosinus nitroreducens TaxID=2018668 RepID=A0ABT8QXG1_9FIRM|nr:ABC transporter permease [Desulfosporosinus nitroreducens]MDO0825542.1 ABC transporter permease [Desulfosporosinus nitroreducens]